MATNLPKSVLIHETLSTGLLGKAPTVHTHVEADITDLGSYLTEVEGTDVLSTSEAGGTKFLREDGDGTSSWQAVPGGHTQNTDTGTTTNTFVIDSDSTTGKITLDVALNGGEDHNMTITNEAMTADVTITLPAVSGTVLIDDDIGSTVQGYDANIVSDASYVHTDNNYTDADQTLVGSIEGKQEYHGVEDYTGLAFSDANKALTLLTISYWYKGVYYTSESPVTCDLDLTADRDNSVNTLANNTLYYFYFKDATGKLYWSDSPWSFRDNVFVVTVFWNGTNGACQKECHNHTRDIDWHLWSHDTIGTRYESGSNVTYPSVAVDGSLQIETGTYHDEDIDFATGQCTTMRGWFKVNSTTYTFLNYALPYLGTAGQPQWLDTDDYTLKNVGASDFVRMWVYASLDISRPIYMIPTHAATAYNTLALARADTVPTQIGTNINTEYKLIYSFIFQGNGDFIEKVDYRSSSPVPGGGTPAVAAGSVSFVPTGTISASDVQNALAELDTEKVPITRISDTAYDAGTWDTNTDIPTKNAIRDKFETLHTQNTDTGTTSNTFTVDSDSTTGKIIIDVAPSFDYSLTLTNEALTDNITATFQNYTGTVAFLSDTKWGYSDVDYEAGFGGYPLVKFFNINEDADEGFPHQLPNPALHSGNIILIRLGALTNPVTFDSGVSETIIFNTVGQLVLYISDGTIWSVISKYGFDLLDAELANGKFSGGHIFGLIISMSAGTITVSAGEARNEANTGDLVLASAITKDVNAAWAVGTNAGGMNTGSAVSETWYEVILIKRVDTGVVDVMVSTTANRATLPANYTLSRRIGWIKTSTIDEDYYPVLTYTQIGDHFTWLAQVNAGTTKATAAAAITLAAPPNTIARFRATADMSTNTNANAVIVFSEIVEGNVTPAVTTGIGSLGYWDLATGVTAGHFELRVSSTSTIEHDSSVQDTNFDISTFGWIDTRCRLQNI